MRLLLALLIFLVVMTGCFSREYTLPNLRTPTPEPSVQEHTPYALLVGSHFGWVQLEQLNNSNFTINNGGYLRQYPGNFLWQKIELVKGSYEFSQSDDAVRRAQDMNKIIIPQIWPLNRIDQTVCRPKAVPACEASEYDIFIKRQKDYYLPTDRCAPCNLTQYTEFVMTTVERYDGDGREDMPGLIYPLKQWEFYDRPEIHSEVVTFFAGSREEYREMIKATHDGMKRACADCELLHSAIPGITDDIITYWKDVYNDRTFDISNLQSYDSAGDLGVSSFRAAFPGHDIIWITRTLPSSGDTESLIIPYAEAFSAGADVIFLGEEQNAHARQDIISTMITTLDHFTHARKVEAGLYEFTFDDRKVYVTTQASKAPSGTMMDVHGREITQAGNQVVYITVK